MPCGRAAACRLPGGDAAAEGPVQVEAAAAAGAVQRFAHEVKAGAALELEVRVHLPQGKAAAGHLGLLPAAGGEPLKPPVFGGAGQLLPLARGESGCVRQGGGGPQRPAQLWVQQAQPEVGRALPCRLPGVGGQQPGEGRFVQRREQVQLHGGGFRPAARGQQAGQLHDADAGKPVVGELHFARLHGQHMGAVQQGSRRFGADARQRFVRGCALQGGQAGVKRLHPAAALPGEAGAEAVGAELRPGCAAHGADDGVGPQGLGGALGVLELHRVAAPALGQGAHGAAGAQLHPAACQVVLQQGQHIRCLVGVRVHPARFVGAGVQAVGGQPAQRVGGVHGLQQRAQCGGVGREIPLRRDAGVVQVAAAVAGGQQLFARLRAAFQHGHLRGGRSFGRRQRGGQPGGTAAQNEDVCHAGTCLSCKNLLSL